MRTNKRNVLGLLILTFMVLVSPLYGDDLPIYQIGLVIDGPWGAEIPMLESIKSEILELTSGEFNVQFPPSKIIQADWSIQGVRNAIDQLLSDPEVDLILTLGFSASHEVCHRSQLSKPVIAPFVLDAELQGFPIKNGKSGVENLNYISVPVTFKRDMQIFQEIVDFKKLAILLNQHLLESFPDFLQRTKDLFEDLPFTVHVVGVGTRILNALSQLPEDIDAVYVLPLPHISEQEYKTLIDGLIDRKLPSFSYSGAERVEQGMLAGLNKDALSRVSRRVALNVQRILLGDKPESIPVAISLDMQLTINMMTANAIDVYPSWAVVTEAEIVPREKPRVERQLNILTAVQEAIEVNLDLAAKEYYVAAGKQNVNEARAKLLPSIELAGNYLIIDKDRAENSMGQQAERTLSGTVTATQVIYSEPAWANLSIQKNVQKTREYDHALLKLDIIHEAATAYLNVLRAKTYERIQQENLRVTRKNLDFARVREVVGSAGPAEVYRWESEIASNRKAVIEINARRNLAEMQFNRLLHRPAEESFATQEMDINDPILITSYRDLFKFIDNKQAFKYFRQFMVEDALNNSPELASLDAAIAVQERVLRSASHSFWSPTIALQGQVENIFSREGEGTDASIDLPPEIPFSMEFPQPKDFSWYVGLNASLPLFQGGEKFAIRQKAVQELAQLRSERDAIAERIEQRIRSALHVAGASNASIAQAKLAAEAADKSLNVVQNAYSQGLVSAIELLDAQNAALITDRVAANVVYDFLIDLMEVERAYGRFNFFSTEERRKDFIRRIYLYFEKVGMPIK